MKYDETVDELFARQTIYDGDCRLWTGAKARQLYGHTWSQLEGRLIQVHRLSYEHYKSALEPGQQIHHLCGKPACVNPAHLMAVNAETHARIDPKYGRRHVTACPHGHPYTPDNIKWVVRIRRGKAYKGRSCRTCHRLEEAVQTAAMKQFLREPAVIERLELLKAELRKSHRRQ